MNLLKNKEEMKIRNYFNGKCKLCNKVITIGSKSGLCKSCSAKNKATNKIEKICVKCNKSYLTFKCRLDTKIYCSKECYNIDMIGKKLSIERIQSHIKNRKGYNSHLWKGGKTIKSKIIRGSFQYKLWRESVFKRDNWTCIFCGIRSKKGIKVILQADHIKPFAIYPELRFVIDNGRTLCLDCHKTTDTYGGKMLKYIKI